MQEELNPFEQTENKKGKYTSKSYENRDPNGYKIKCGNWYPLYRAEYGGHIFYKIMVSKKDINGDPIRLYKSVSFYKDGERITSIRDGVLVKPLRFQEDGYYTKNDKYNVVWNLKIFDWEIQETEEHNVSDAINDYKKQLNVNDIDFNDDDLPF